jgi:hypothetical protein
MHVCNWTHTASIPPCCSLAQTPTDVYICTCPSLSFRFLPVSVGEPMHACLCACAGFPVCTTCEVCPIVCVAVVSVLPCAFLLLADVMSSFLKVRVIALASNRAKRHEDGIGRGRGFSAFSVLVSFLPFSSWQSFHTLFFQKLLGEVLRLRLANASIS